MEKVQIFCSKCNAKLNIPAKLHIRFSCPTCKEKYEAINGLVLGVTVKFGEAETQENGKRNPPAAQQSVAPGTAGAGKAGWWAGALEAVRAVKAKMSTPYQLAAIVLVIAVCFGVGYALDRRIKAGHAQAIRAAKEKVLSGMIDCLKRHDFNAAYAYTAPETVKYLKIVEAMYVFGDSTAISRSLATLKFNLDSTTLYNYYLSYDSDSTKNNILPVELVQQDNAYLVQVNRKHFWKD